MDYDEERKESDADAETDAGQEEEEEEEENSQEGSGAEDGDDDADADATDKASVATGSARSARRGGAKAPRSAKTVRGKPEKTHLVKPKIEKSKAHRQFGKCLICTKGTQDCYCSPSPPIFPPPPQLAHKYFWSTALVIKVVLPFCAHVATLILCAALSGRGGGAAAGGPLPCVQLQLYRPQREGTRGQPRPAKDINFKVSAAQGLHSTTTAVTRPLLTFCTTLLVVGALLQYRAPLCGVVLVNFRGHDVAHWYTQAAFRWYLA